MCISFVLFVLVLDFFFFFYIYISKLFFLHTMVGLYFYKKCTVLSGLFFLQILFPNGIDALGSVKTNLVLRRLALL